MDSVKNFLQPHIVSIESSEPAATGAKLMTSEETKVLIVKENGKHIGLVTASDFVAKIIAAELNGANVKIGDIASRPLITINNDAPMNEALALMLDHNIRSLVVTENEQPCGLLHSKDIAAYYFQDVLKISNPIARFWANNTIAMKESNPSPNW